jgi:hypothetical protein
MLRGRRYSLPGDDKMRSCLDSGSVNCRPLRSNGERLSSSARNSSRSAGSFATFHSQLVVVGRQIHNAAS